MPWYRLYCIDGEGSIASVEEFSARDDVEAVRISREALSAQPLELWCRSRIVESLSPREGGHC
jgi:hypothetical protein